MADYVDDNGEILEIPEGADRLFWTAQQLQDAADQIKAWERRAGACKALLIAEQDERRAVYGDVSVRVQQNIRKTLDIGEVRAWLESAPFPPETLADMAHAAKDFDLSLVEDPWLKAALGEYVKEAPTRAFVVVERVRKLAPSREPQAVLA